MRVAQTICFIVNMRILAAKPYITADYACDDRMKIRRGISTGQVAIAAVVIIILVGVGAYYAGTSSGSQSSTTTTTTTTKPTTTTTTPITTTTTTTTTTNAIVAPPLIVQRNAPYSDADPRDTSSIDVAQQSYETLTYLSPDGTVMPGLATAWKSVNGSTWQYTLRQGVTFHDGTPFNATDVIFSIKNTIAWGGGDAPDVWAFFKSAVAEGPYTIDLTFTQPVNAPIVTSAAYAAFIFSHKVVSQCGCANDLSALHTWFNAYHDDGSGPYVINSTGSSLTGGVWKMYAYQNYWGGWKAGQVQNIVFKYISNVNTAINLAEQGQLDQIGISGNFQYVPSLLNSGLKIYEGPTHGSIWLLFNTQHQFLNNTLVREALLTAVNFQQVLQQAYYNYGINWGGMVNPGLAYYDSSAPNYKVAGNLTAAKALMKEAGYPGGLNVTWTLTYSTGSPFEATIASLLNTYWQPFGVTIKLDGLSFTNQAIKAGYVNGSNPFIPGPISYAKTSNAQDLALLNWNGATADPWLVADELFAIQNAPYQNDILFNWSYWQNSTFSNLLNQFSQIEGTNPTQAAQDIKTLNTLFYQGAPGWAMFQGEQIWVVSPHWHGVVMNPNYSFDYFFYYQWTYQP